MRPLFTVTACATLVLLVSVNARAKDDLLDTLAQKGVLTAEEYQKLKGQRAASDVVLTTDDGFKLASADAPAARRAD